MSKVVLPKTAEYVNYLEGLVGSMNTGGMLTEMEQEMLVSKAEGYWEEIYRVDASLAAAAVELMDSWQGAPTPSERAELRSLLANDAERVDGGV